MSPSAVSTSLWTLPGVVAPAVSLGVGTEQSFTAGLCWAISDNPNLSVGVKLAGSHLRKKRELMSPVHLKTSPCICWLMCWIPASWKMSGGKALNHKDLWEKNPFRYDFWSLLLQSYPREMSDKAAHCLMLWALTGNNRQLYPCARRTQNVWN